MYYIPSDVSARLYTVTRGTKQRPPSRVKMYNSTTFLKHFCTCVHPNQRMYPWTSSIHTAKIITYLWRVVPFLCTPGLDRDLPMSIRSSPSSVTLGASPPELITYSDLNQHHLERSRIPPARKPRRRCCHRCSHVTPIEFRSCLVRESAPPIRAFLLGVDWSQCTASLILAHVNSAQRIVTSPPSVDSHAYIHFLI